MSRFGASPRSADAIGPAVVIFPIAPDCADDVAVTLLHDFLRAELAITGINSDKRPMNFAPNAQSMRDAQPAVPIVAVERPFDFSGAEYRLLHQRSGATAFQAPRWLDRLHRDLAPTFGAEPVTLTVRDPRDGRLMLVLPLMRRRRHGVTFLEFADFGLCDYQGTIHDPSDRPLLLADATLRKRVAAALPGHDALALAKLGEDPLLDHLFPGARRARMRVSAYPARLRPDWTEWRTATLDMSFRKNLDVKRRRLLRTGPAEFTLLRDPEAITRAFDALRGYRAERFKAIGAPDLLANDAVHAFYRSMAIEGARDGTTRTQCLMLADVPIAVLFGLVHDGVYSMLLIGLDAARHGRLSPGLLAIEDSMRAAIETGDRVYDFTIGDHPYKGQFGGAAVPLYEWHQARTLRGQAAVLATTLAREAKRVLKPLLKPDKRAPAKDAE